MLFIRTVSFLAGSALVLAVMVSAVKTVVVPRNAPARISRRLFRMMGGLFRLRLRRVRTYEDRDRVMALYAPLSLVLLPGVWVALVIGGFSGVFWGVRGGSVRDAVILSGSSITTLGFFAPDSGPADIAAVVEAVIGLGVVALMISYLPAIYSSFQRRELLVSQLEVRAGQPPTAVRMIIRHNDIGWLERSTELFTRWEEWFADIEETHTSQAALVFFRSPLPTRSWVTAAGAVLDSAALMVSTVDGPRSPEAQLCLRAGFLSLRRIAGSLDISFDPDPPSTATISIDRSEFDRAYAELQSAGVPVIVDVEAAWRSFAGWRVNYDTVLLALAEATMAPFAPWSSDRSITRGLVQRSPEGPIAP